MLAYAFDSHTVGGRLAFANRSGGAAVAVDEGSFVVTGREPPVSLTRAPAAEMADRVSSGLCAPTWTTRPAPSRPWRRKRRSRERTR